MVFGFNWIIDNMFASAYHSKNSDEHDEWYKKRRNLIYDSDFWPNHKHLNLHKQHTHTANTKPAQTIGAEQVNRILCYWIFFFVCLFVILRNLSFIFFAEGHLSLNFIYDQCAPKSLIESRENPVCLIGAAQTKRYWSRTKCVVCFIWISIRDEIPPKTNFNARRHTKQRQQTTNKKKKKKKKTSTQ